MVSEKFVNHFAVDYRKIDVRWGKKIKDIFTENDLFFRASKRTGFHRRANSSNQD